MTPCILFQGHIKPNGYGQKWVGVHYSPQNKRHCINLVPCLTVWVRLPGGNEP